MTNPIVVKIHKDYVESAVDDGYRMYKLIVRREVKATFQKNKETKKTKKTRKNRGKINYLICKLNNFKLNKYIRWQTLLI